MPELPEVESLVRGLGKAIVGETVKDVEVFLEKIVASHGTTRKPNKKKTQEFITQLIGRKIVSVKRRAKNIIITLDDKSVILIHLKMTGQLVFVPNQKTNKSKGENKVKALVAGGHPITESYTSTLPHKHTYIIFTLGSGSLYYNDVRQFGYVLYYPNFDTVLADNHFKGIGLEPFNAGFTVDYLEEKIKKKNKSLKTALLEQDIVVGCGNIYADEICFATKIVPTKNCRALSKKEITLLHKNIISILEKAISLGGSSVSNYLLADGTRGNYAREHKVYGRGGKECFVCGSTLQSIKLGGRTTVYCKRCQQ